VWEITRKYSRGSSANNHRIGEAAGVFIATSYFREIDGAARWRQQSRDILAAEIVDQTHADGCTREQALGYHLFVLEFFLLAEIVARKIGADFGPAYQERLQAMVTFLGSLTEGGTVSPMIGDSDDGYVLDLGSSHAPEAFFCIGATLFARSDFKQWADAFTEPARWLLGAGAQEAFDRLPPTPADHPIVSHAFPSCGYYLLQYGHRGAKDRISVVFDCGELGFTSIAAHGHADALSFTLRAFGFDVLVDPGTYDYFSFPEWREYFRSTRAHNTVVVDGVDQSVMQGPFLWGPRAEARCIAWRPTSDGGEVTGEHTGYVRLTDPVIHRRTLSLEGSSGVLTIRDEIVAKGAHEIAIYFHLAEDTALSTRPGNQFRIDVAGHTVMLDVDERLAVETLKGSEAPIAGWVSRSYHRKVPATTLVARGRTNRAATFVSRIHIGS
jgi:hypothetical protein